MLKWTDSIDYAWHSIAYNSQSFINDPTIFYFAASTDDAISVVVEYFKPRSSNENLFALP